MNQVKPHAITGEKVRKESYILPFAGVMSKYHHFVAELGKGFHKFGEVIHMFYLV